MNLQTFLCLDAVSTFNCPVCTHEFVKEKLFCFLPNVCIQAHSICYTTTFVDFINTLISLYALAKTTSDNLTHLDNVAYNTLGNRVTTSTRTNISCSENVAYSTVSNTQELTANTPTGHTALYEEVQLEK